jgi:hypothetical protein
VQGRFNQLLPQFVTPVAGLWAIHMAIIGSAKFVNEMRETVISGFYNKEPISASHRDQMLFDWGLSMAATIGICVIFGGLLLAAAVFLTDAWFLRISLGAIALYSFGCAIAFRLCASGDRDLMREAVNDAFAKEKLAAPKASVT